MLFNVIQKGVFIVLWFPVRLIFHFFLHYKVESKEDLSSLKGPLIIASNHTSFLDPFLIGAAFPIFSQIYPIRYATWYRYYYIFWPFINLFGAFPVRKKIGLEKTLRRGIRILEKGGVVGIFPEGKRRHLGRPRKPRRGVAFLAAKTNSPILPILIEGTIGLSVKEFLFRRRFVTIKIGEKFFLPKYDISRKKGLNYLAELILNKIKELK